MPGPVPKRPEMRQRRNKTSTHAVLSDDAPTRVRRPSLPARATEDRSWHRLTLSWWRDTWRSPMAEEYLAADVHGLFILAELVDAFWYTPSVALANEIRQHRQCYGLTPIDRRRLQWEVGKAGAVARRPVRPDQPARPFDDPRRALRAVQ